MLQTSETLQLPTRRGHRTYTAQFKVEMVAACLKPGASISALALSQGMNPNVVHRWLREYERQGLHDVNAMGASQSKASALVGEFVPLPLLTTASKNKTTTIEVELRKGDLYLNVRWPADLSAEFATWAAALLR
jgi:transposase